MDFSTKTLLVITLTYNSFVKEQIDLLAPYFKKIYVFVRFNPISEIARFVPIGYLSPFRKKTMIDLTNKPDNVEIVLNNVFFAPITFFYNLLGHMHFNSVYRQIKKMNLHFDMIHCHFIWSSGYVGLKLKELYNVPLVVTAHGFDVYTFPFKSKYIKKNTIQILNRANAVITVSNSNKKILKNLGVKNEIHLIPNGFSTKLFYPKDKNLVRKEKNLVNTKYIVVSIGYLVPIKGHKYLIEAISILKRNYDLHVTCIIIGDGSERKKLEKLAKRLDVCNLVKFLGYIPHHELNSWINLADVLVLPSLKESFGLVQLEAMSCGIPVVSTKTNGSKELVISEELGLLVEPGNANALAEKIKEALHKSWDSQVIIKYASGFCWLNITKKILSIYEEINNN